jgi:hypothetical protein
MSLRKFELQPIADLAVHPDVPVLEALHQAIPATVIRRTLASTHSLGTHCWRVPAELVVALVIALGFWSRDSISAVLAQLVEGLRARDPARWLTWQPPAKSTLTEARQRLGVRPMRELFGRVARPIATPDTPGAFRFGLRVMAIDGTSLTMPDSPENRRVFGSASTEHGSGEWTTTTGAFPLLRLVLLIECGTHAVCDAVMRPWSDGEPPAARDLLRTVTEEMLVLWDRGLHSWDMLHATQQRGAAFLGRVRSTIRLPIETVLADGTYLSTVYPSYRHRQQQRDGIVVRVIEYTIDDLARPKRGERYRLVTSLLDPAHATAEALAHTYHERWEQETLNGELKTHQLARTPATALRSRRPREVIQEVYGLLLAHWAVRRLMAEAATQHGLDPDQLSFLGALRVLRRAVPRFQQWGDRPDVTPLCSPRCLTSWPSSAPTHGAIDTTPAW